MIHFTIAIVKVHILLISNLSSGLLLSACPFLYLELILKVANLLILLKDSSWRTLYYLKWKELNFFAFHFCPQTYLFRLLALLTFRFPLFFSYFRDPYAYRLTQTLTLHSSGKFPVSFTSRLIIFTHELSLYTLFKHLESKMVSLTSLFLH